LAWSERNTSGGVALREFEPGRAEVVARETALGSDDQIMGFVAQAIADGPAVVAVDAPLVVPNEWGARPCDRLVTRRFGRYQAGARPAFRRSPSFPGGRVRGEELVRRLADLGFRHDPHVPQRSPGRHVIEVYPHPATVVLFGLKRTLKYKAVNRSRAERLPEYRRYQELLCGLEEAEPALVPPAFLDQDVEELRGATLKRYEDLLDALLCAYLAWWCWYWGPAGYEVIGDLENGYVMVPRRTS
jgi:predicted RNase H-like nuclease